MNASHLRHSFEYYLGYLGVRKQLFKAGRNKKTLCVTLYQSHNLDSIGLGHKTNHNSSNEMISISCLIASGS